MLTFYCPNCWEIVTEDQSTCPNCGYVLGEFNKFSYEDKLLAALHHSVPERRIMAAQILGNRSSQRAIPQFLEIITGDESDYFFLRAVLLAAIKIEHPDRAIILSRASQHSSDLVRHLAAKLMAQLQGNSQPNTWDRHTG